MRLPFFIIIFFINFAYSQSPAGIWYFGSKAGISFNTGSNPVSLNDGQLDTFEGCATLCDDSGNLLFYTNGVKIWNRNHLVMPNGNGLFGDPSSTQSAIIIPKPNNTNIFYVFTVDEIGKSNGLNYSIIDLTLDNGLGDVTSKNNALITPTLEKITVVQHANGINFWVISHKYNSNQFVCYEITPSGINAPITSNVGTTLGNDPQRTIGYMKSSPNGEFVACANSGTGSEMQLFKFNNTSGQLNLLSTSSLDSDNLGAYGIEFSSNSKFLYVSRIDSPSFTSQIFQYDVESQNATLINQSKTLVAEFVSDEFNIGTIAALQLAPNQKIYVARNNCAFLGAINSPNTPGLGCDFIPNAVSLGSNVCYYGLPSFITSYLDLNFTSSNFCYGSATEFKIPEIENVISQSWNFGDLSSSNNTSTLEEPSHTFMATGTYTVTLTIQTATTTKTFTKQIQIIASPVAYQPTNFILCGDSNNTALFTLSDKNNEILGSQSPSDYSISYHLSLIEAENNDNPLPANYTNISNPQTIFARIQANVVGECSDITSFQLIVKPKPQLDSDIEIFYCLNSFPDKIILSAGNLNTNEVLSFQWSNGETTQTIQVNEAGIYSVQITNSFGCNATRTITVVNSEKATINYTIEGSIGNYSLVVNPIGTGNYVYSLDYANGNYQTSNVFENIIAGNHIIYVKDLNGCGIVFGEFYVIGYPLYFTPNGDGINDFWNFKGSFLDIKTIAIFDRYGKFIYEIKPNSPGWDGTSNKRNLPSTDYWFYAVLKDGQEVKGHFTLKR